jgi:hypothetical protein
VSSWPLPQRPGGKTAPRTYFGANSGNIEQVHSTPPLPNSTQPPMASGKTARLKPIRAITYGFSPFLTGGGPAPRRRQRPISVAHIAGPTGHRIARPATIMSALGTSTMRPLSAAKFRAGAPIARERFAASQVPRHSRN